MRPKTILKVLATKYCARNLSSESQDNGFFYMLQRRDKKSRRRAYGNGNETVVLNSRCAKKVEIGVADVADLSID
jgi:hypothetical protein